MRMQRTLSFVLLAATAWAAGCTPERPPNQAAAPDAAATSSTAQAPQALDAVTTLPAYQWRLTAATDAAGQPLASFFPTPDQRLGLQFAEGRVGVTGSCNRLSAAYQLPEPARLQLGQAMSTMMACPPPLAAADAAFGKFLQGSLQVALEGDATAPRLRLTAADGTALAFDGTATPETRFGGPGERAFLEVSPQPCAAPEASTGRCLTVRDVRFDDQGLPVGEPGAWRSLPQGIEGYAAVPGEQQIVRVKRFQRDGAAGGATEELYVLDLVVQSRSVQ